MAPLPLVGRDRETAALDALVAGITEGGGALLLRGEPGIGKSALVEFAVDRARAAGFQVLTCVGVESETRLPFAGLHQLLRPVAAGLGVLEAADLDVLRVAFGEIAVQEIAPGAAGTGALSVHRVAMAVLTLLTSIAERAPVLIAADDVHWLDEPTGEVLAFVGRRLRADPVLLLAASRDGEPGGPVAAAGLDELRLERLDERDAAALLDARTAADPAVREQLLAWAAGNPLALIELPLAASEFVALDGPGLSARPAGEPAGDWVAAAERLPLTRRLEQAFAARLSGLPVITGDVLLAAALNDGADLAEISDAAGRLAGRPVTAEDLAPVQTAGLAELTAEGTLRFRHPLVRAAVHNAASATRRRAVHDALAGALSASPGRRLWHQAASAAGPDEALATALEELAEDVNRRGAAATAVVAYQRAAQLSVDRRRRGERLAWAGVIAFELGRAELVERLRADAEAMDLSLYIRFRLTWLRENFSVTGLSGVSRLSEVAELAERLRINGDHEPALAALEAVALRCFWSNPDPDVLRRLVGTAESLPAAEDDPMLIYALAMFAPVDRGVTLLARLRQIDLAAVDVWGLHHLGMACLGLGDVPRAMAALSAATARCREEGRLGLLGLNVFGNAWAAALAGKPEVAVPAAEEATRLLSEAGLILFVPCAQLVTGLLAARRGDVATAADLADEAERILLFTGISPLLALVRYVRGTAALAVERHEEAYGELARVFDPEDVSYHPHLRSWVLPELVEAAVHSGHLSQASARHAELAPLAGTSPLLAAALAVTAPQLAPDDAAGARYDEALDAVPADLPLHRARLLLAQGGWLRRNRQVARSRATLREARDLLDAAGALAWGERARRELRAAGEDSAVRAPTVLDLLTPQELHIAQLAADGLSNRDIGQRLYLSPRTVGSHLYRIFPKLGVTSRAGLSAMVAGAQAAAGSQGQ